MEINLNPKDLDEYVRKVLLESSIGTKLRELIDYELKHSFGTWNNKYENVVRGMIYDLIKEMVNQDCYRDIIKNAIQTKLTAEFMERVINSTVERVVKKISDNF